MLKLGIFLRSPGTRVSRAGLAFLVLAFASGPARADFLDDLFGGPEPAARPQASAPSHRERAAAPERAHRRENTLRTEVRMMPVVERAKPRAGRAQVAAQNPAPPKVDGSTAAGSKPVAVALCAPEETIAGAQPSSLLAYDKTLRNGDILVTDGGVQVFRGHTACPHSARDFIALSSAGLPRGKRNVLLAIEEATRRPGGYLLTANIEKR
jgi:hypothetical protein